MEIVEEEYDFDNWTTEELFNHLIDLHQIPYEEEFEDWIKYKSQMLYMCKETYGRQRETV